MSKKTIWITGGSTGIGKALAIKFASKGWNVAVSARRTELLNELSNKTRYLIKITKFRTQHNRKKKHFTNTFQRFVGSER